MASFNNVTLLGNLTRDPELKYTPKGTCVAKIGLALNRKWKDDAGAIHEEVTFVDVDLWGRTAENVGQYMRKGSSMLVSGRLKLDQWDDKTTGQKRSRLGVVGETVQFISTPEKTNGAQPTARRTATTAPAQQPVEGDGPPDADDVPF